MGDRPSRENITPCLHSGLRWFSLVFPEEFIFRSPDEEEQNEGIFRVACIVANDADEAVDAETLGDIIFERLLEDLEPEFDSMIEVEATYSDTVRHLACV